VKLTKSLLKKIVREELINSQGLVTNFQNGDTVKDINPDCPHVGSEGVVIKVTTDDVTYTVTNNGKRYKKGDELTKTKDQIVKLKSDEMAEDFAVGSRKDRVTKTKKRAEVFGHTMVGEVDDPTWDLTKKKDRGDQIGESILKESRLSFKIKNLGDTKLKNLIVRAIKKLSGSRIEGIGMDYIHLKIEPDYMEVLGDFIKKYDKNKNVYILNNINQNIFDMKRGINKLGEVKLKEAKENPIDVARRIVKNRQSEKVGGVLVDMQTANLIVQIYDKVNSSNKKHMEKTPMKKLGVLVWKIAKKARAR